MSNKTIIWFIVLLLTISVATAIDTTNLISYWAFNTNNNNQPDSHGGQTMVMTGAAYRSAGLLGGAYYWDGVNDKGEVASNAAFVAGNVSISLWINATDLATQQAIIRAWQSNSLWNIQLRGDVAGDNFSAQMHDSVTHYGLVPPVVNTWTHLVVTTDCVVQNVTFYVNGAAAGSFNDATIDCDAINETIYIGLSEGDFWDYSGMLDEMAIFNKSLNLTEVQDLYNGGAGLAYPFVAVVNNFTITASDEWNGTSILVFNATVDGVGYNTTNGTIYTTILENSTSLHNVTVWATDYYARVYTNVNVSSDLAAELHQAQVCFNATTKISDVYINMTSYHVTGQSSEECFNISSGSYTVTGVRAGWYNATEVFSVTALTNTTVTVTGVYSSLVNISVYYPNGTSLLVWGAQLSSPTYPAWSGENLSTTNGTVWFNAVNGTYTAFINSSFGNQTFSFVVDQTTENIPFYFFALDNCSTYTQTILNFTLLDEATEALVNGSFDIWFQIQSDYIAGLLEYNFSYSGGNYYSICVPQNTVTNWTADAQATYSLLPTYAEKNYYLVDFPLNSSETKINLYLTNGTTQVNLRVRDYNDDPIQDVYIRVLSYDVGTNSYTTTEIVKTDDEGDAWAQIILNTEWYAFILVYEDEVVLQTLPTKITSTTRTFRINLGEDYSARYDQIQGMSHALTYNNATLTFHFVWSDPTGSVQNGCLKLTRRTMNGDTDLNTTCQTSTAADILMTIPESVGDNTYIATSYVTYSGGQSFVLDTLSVNFNNTYQVFGASGLFYSMLIIIVLIMVGIWHPVLAVVFMVVGVIITNVLGLFYLNWSYVIVLIILAAITIYRVGKSD